jgi:hypothetical protein
LKGAHTHEKVYGIEIMLTRIMQGLRQTID